MNTITVDFREHADELLLELHDNYGFNVVRKALEIGDYFIPPETIVERKTTSDLAISIVDGRLFSQAYRLSERTENPIIIIEGEDLDGLNVSINAIKGALISLAQTFRIPVLRTKDQRDSAWYMNQLHEQRERIGQNKGVKKGYYPKRAENQRRYILKALPGVGPKIAKTLLEEFGSVKSLANAELDDLKKVPGLGKVKAEKVYQILRENKTPYRANYFETNDPPKEH